MFLDNVRVPAANLIGEEGQGWGYGKVLLDRERGVTAATTMRLRQQLRGAWVAAAQARTVRGALLEDPVIADRLAQLEIEVIALEGMVMRTMAEAASGKDSGPRASMIKVRWSALLQEITEFCRAAEMTPSGIVDLPSAAGTSKMAAWARALLSFTRSRVITTSLRP